MVGQHRVELFVVGSTARDETRVIRIVRVGQPTFERDALSRRCGRVAEGNGKPKRTTISPESGA